MGYSPGTKPIRRFLRAAAAAALLGSVALAATEGPLESIRFEPGDTIRAFAERHLKDPDLWPQILTLSGLSSPTQIVPGTELKVPVVQVAAADDALASSLVAIQRATAEGARIFAPVEIEGAIENRETAVERRGDGIWNEVVLYAGYATDLAVTALDISLAQRDRAAEAVLSDVHGTVEGRTPDAPAWSERKLQDVLVEFERVRTLSASTAQVTFRDLSRLRLNPNSNAVIQQMRADPLTGSQTTKVSLVEGDFYALLNQLSDRTDFAVEVPGVETRTRSADFWVRHDAEATRFTNYDAAALEVTTGRETIRIGENEGALLTAGADARRVTVLTRPEPLAPAEGAHLYDAAVDFAWEGPAGTAGYWLEIAGDVDFNTMKSSQWGLREARHTEELEPGRYYWRVSALDQLGLPGTRSLGQRFTVVRDDLPPFLALAAPPEGAILDTAEVRVTGESEFGAVLTLDDRRVPLRENGGFAETITARPGENLVTLVATDPAGNRSELTRRFTYRPPAAAEIAFDATLPRDAEGRFLTRSAALDMRGTTSADPGARLTLLDAAGRVVAETRIEPDGRFAFAAPATEAGLRYEVTLSGPTGAVEGSAAFEALHDATPPVLRLDAPAPSVTGLRWLDLAGSAEDAVALTLDGTPVPLEGGRFSAAATLAPGPNRLELVATDAVGNVGLLRIETRLDTDPPEILAATAARPAGAAGPIEIEVAARDPSGLRATAPYILAVGGVERRGFLRCDDAAGACRDTLPPEPGELRLIEIIVEDYAGNAATLTR